MSCAPYTGPDGASCHQCKSRRRLTDLYFCCFMPSKTRTCRKKFCKLCLDKFYDNAKPLKGDELMWTCPSCAGKCTCASCQRGADGNGSAPRRRTSSEIDLEISRDNIINGKTNALGTVFENDARQLLMTLTSLPGVRARINQFVALKGVDDQSKIEAIASLLNHGAFPTPLGDRQAQFHMPPGTDTIVGCDDGVVGVPSVPVADPDDSPFSFQ
ncbi:Zinc-finger domain-containing protein [Plasmodiophora brassicae]|uniref:Zinc-finger domain-containing protein n=1 Tax=Plasmodiophora brassicae TaxID=37360 RepID=A0A0G4IPN7_PLABS|nr:hypothetical protein PBRA_000532 [Plasmodiophora brassicae]